MIYLLAIALILTAFGFVVKGRQRGFSSVLRDPDVAAVSGLLFNSF